MNELTEFLFPSPAQRSFGSTVRWWESRHLAFNMFVAGVGLVSLSALGITTLLPGDLPAPSDWPSIILAFGVMANVCYVLGPTVEMALQKLWGDKLLPAGPILFRMGLPFSVGLALFPALLISMFWVARIVFSLF